MHSRIFQLSEQPISLEEGGITESHFLDSDEYGSKPIFQIADYINGDTNREEDIQWFLNTLPVGLYTFEEDSIIFHEGFKEAYFADSLEKFLKLAEDIKQDNSKFYDSYETYRIHNTIEDKSGFYIYLDENEYETPMDIFVRRYLKIGEKYYFGNTIDYHF